MTLSYGFYNSENGDRVYDAENFSDIFEGVITDGVFSGIGDAFVVSDGSGMDTVVGSGRAWFLGTWNYNDGAKTLPHAAADPSLDRIDTVIIDVNRTSRTNSLSILTGNPAATPVPITLIDTADRKWVPLADVYISAGTTEITAGNITNRVGTDDCPFVTGLVQQLSAQQIIDQWNAEFDAWLLSLADKLDEQTASNLQDQIDNLDERVPIGKNLIINPNARVCQRGTTDTIDMTSDNFSGYPNGPDRWGVYCRQQPATFTFERHTTVDPSNGFNKWWYRVYTDVGNASPPTNDLLIVRQALPERDLREWLKGTPDCQTMTFSMQYSTNVGGVYNIRFIDVRNDREFIAEMTAIGDGATREWEIEVPRDLIGELYASSSLAGLRIAIMLRVGSDLRLGTQAPPDAWTSSDYFDVIRQNAVMGTAAGQFFAFTNVKLEYGSTKTPFVTDDYSELLVNCQRFYEAATAYLNWNRHSSWIGLETVPYRFKSRKISPPQVVTASYFQLLYRQENASYLGDVDVLSVWESRGSDWTGNAEEIQFQIQGMNNVALTPDLWGYPDQFGATEAKITFAIDCEIE